MRKDLTVGGDAPDAAVGIADQIGNGAFAQAVVRDMQDSVFFIYDKQSVGSAGVDLPLGVLCNGTDGKSGYVYTAVVSGFRYPAEGPVFKQIESGVIGADPDTTGGVQKKRADPAGGGTVALQA